MWDTESRVMFTQLFRLPARGLCLSIIKCLHIQHLVLVGVPIYLGGSFISCSFGWRCPYAPLLCVDDFEIFVQSALPLASESEGSLDFSNGN